MGVEVITLGSLPDELDVALPAGGDPKAEGDDHLRNIKIVTKNFYAAWTAANVDARITALEAYTATSDADTLDGQHGAFYQNASNINAGTLSTARLTGTYAIDISGTAANATLAANATAAVLATDALNADNADALGGVPAATVLAGLAGWVNVDKTTTAVQNFTGTGWKTVLDDWLTINSGDAIFASPIVNVSDVSGTNVLGNFDIIFEFRLRMNGGTVGTWCSMPINIASSTQKLDAEKLYVFGPTGLPNNHELIYAEYGNYGAYVRQCLIPAGMIPGITIPTGAVNIKLDVRVHESVTPFPPVDCYSGFQVNRATVIITGKVAP